MKKQMFSWAATIAVVIVAALAWPVLASQIVSISSVGGGGVTTMAAPAAATDANALVISGTTLNAEIADATHPGIVTTAAQTFAGAKTLSGDAIFSAADTTAVSISNGAGGLTWNTGGNTGVLSVGSGLPKITLNGGSTSLNFTGGGDFIQVLANNANAFKIQSSATVMVVLDTTTAALKLIMQPAIAFIPSTATALTAVTSTCAAGSGLALTSDWNRIDTITTTGDAVKLPTCTVGRTVSVTDNVLSGTKNLLVCAPVGGSIDSNVANTGLTITGSASTPLTKKFDCVNGTIWTSK